MMGSGAGFGPDWHRAFYASLDALLSATKSVGQIIKCCFGVDHDHPGLKPFNSLPSEEQDRRSEFQRQFDPHLRAFDQLPLSTSRNISEHRRGYPTATVKTTGLFGVTYEGDPVKSIPTSETRHLDDGFGWLSQPVPVRPLWSDFFIDGRPLFSECRDYRDAAQQLLGEGRRIGSKYTGRRASHRDGRRTLSDHDEGPTIG